MEELEAKAFEIAENCNLFKCDRIKSLESKLQSQVKAIPSEGRILDAIYFYCNTNGYDLTRRELRVGLSEAIHKLIQDKGEVG